MIQQNEEFLTAQELADILKVRLSWVRWMTHQGKLPLYHVGKYTRYLFSEVGKVLKSKSDGLLTKT